jgi:hypothetical protein
MCSTVDVDSVLVLLQSAYVAMLPMFQRDMLAQSSVS